MNGNSITDDRKPKKKIPYLQCSIENKPSFVSFIEITQIGVATERKTIIKETIIQRGIKSIFIILFTSVVLILFLNSSGNNE